MKWLIGVVIGFGVLACSKPNDSSIVHPNLVRPEEPTVVGMSADDPGVAAAKRMAQDGLPHFISTLNAAKKGEDFVIKAPFATSQPGQDEHIWLNELTHSGSSFKGKLDNNPLAIPGKKLGSTVEVKDADVEDWMIAHADGSQEGGFSVGPISKEVGK